MKQMMIHFAKKAVFHFALIIGVTLAGFEVRATIVNNLAVPRLESVDRLDNEGILFNATYGDSCGSLGVKAQLYLIDDWGTPRFQGSCMANPKDHCVPTPHNKCQQLTQAFSTGHCSFRRPVPSGTPSSKIFLRLWKANAACTHFADEVGRVSDGYVDHFLTNVKPAVSNSIAYRGFTQNRLVAISKPNYEIKMDRNGGATYELYNKRASLSGGSSIANALHAHSGAAMQVAVHDHEGGKVIPDSCDQSQGYWNPTQAGFSCGYNHGQVYTHSDGPVPGSDSGLRIECDGVRNNLCTTVANQVKFSKHRMYNWDYGASYTGPFNPQDQGYLTQEVNAFDNYAVYDVAFEHQRPAAFSGPIEIPATYFSNSFRRYYTKYVDGRFEAVDIPLRRTAGEFMYARQTNDERSWFSVENTSGVENDAFTVAWFYSRETQADITLPGFAVEETDVFGAIKLRSQPIIKFQKGKEYRFRYVVFPFRFDEVIDSPYGRLRVDQVIERMKQDYLRLSAPVFNVREYKLLNGDLAGLTESQLQAHWLAHGIHEGRRASIKFHSIDYLHMYADLRAAYGYNYGGAIDHYLGYGIHEGRAGSMRNHPLVFQASVYKSLNPDLAGLSALGLNVHWLHHGINEGRRASRNFSSQAYLARYEDLRSGYGPYNYQGAISHYVIWGHAEGRRGLP